MNQILIGVVATLAVALGVSWFKMSSQTERIAGLETSLSAARLDASSARLAIDVTDAYLEGERRRNSDLTTRVEYLQGLSIGGCADENIDDRLLSFPDGL